MIADENFMESFLGGRFLIHCRYSQILKHYIGRVVRLSALVGILSLLIVKTIPSLYIGTVELTLDPAPATGGLNHSIIEQLSQSKRYESQEKKITENLAKNLFIKLKSFDVKALDKALQEAISEHLYIQRIKQSMRKMLPFMPQRNAPVLSSKQVKSLRNGYTLEKIEQHLSLGYMKYPERILVEYEDPNSSVAIIIAALAAELLFESGKNDSLNSEPMTDDIILQTRISEPSNISYSTEILKPNVSLIVSLSVGISLFLLSILVLMLERLKANQVGGNPAETRERLQNQNDDIYY